MPSTTYKKGTWKATCDICGFNYHASELKLMWNGLYACTQNKCWNPRQPQDFLRGVKDDPSVAWTRPEGADVETDTSGWATIDSVPSGTFDGSL